MTSNVDDKAKKNYFWVNFISILSWIKLSNKSRVKFLIPKSKKRLELIISLKTYTSNQSHVQLHHVGHKYIQLIKNVNQSTSIHRTKLLRSTTFVHPNPHSWLIRNNKTKRKFFHFSFCLYFYFLLVHELKKPKHNEKNCVHKKMNIHICLLYKLVPNEFTWNIIIMWIYQNILFIRWKEIKRLNAEKRENKKLIRLYC